MYPLKKLKFFESNPKGEFEGANPQKFLFGNFPIETSVEVISEKLKEAMRLTEYRQIQNP
ncbi:MAG: hypothetical protein KF734_20050 [Saprospiraceae bacterium]|nr:hypothetical protein [Saprospiraceae bacterium]